MKNILGREVPFKPFEGIKNQKSENRDVKPKKRKNVQAQIINFDDILNNIDIKDGSTISFHHHLRNGDYILNMVMDMLYKNKVRDLTIMPSSIFSIHKDIIKYIKEEVITNIKTSYLSEDVAKSISKGALKNPIHITSHGGRARSILENEDIIDVAFIAAPSVDINGRINGSIGKSACGSIGYAIADIMCAKKVVVLTDNLMDYVEQSDVDQGYVDYIVEVKSIGDPQKIVSGTTQITKDPIGLKIARDTAKVIDALGLIKDGFSLQTGAGGISLAVSKEVGDIMREKSIKGSFGIGGITSYFVDMLEDGLFEELIDVQCFDKGAISSSRKNKNHKKVSASKYANPNDDSYAKKLDCVILGASQIDMDFNVNVTTGLDGVILGGSGGHCDTAAGSKVSIITSKLFNARISVIVDEVITVTTPGDAIDILVTDYGIAINPKRVDLIEKLKDNKNLKITSIEKLYEKAISLTGKAKKKKLSDEVIGYSVFSDGSLLDTIKKCD